HSATKYLGGHGTSIAGVIVDGGSFDYAQYPERFPNYNQPDPSYHGLVYARDLGVGSPLGANLAFILKARVQLLRDIGAALSPFNAFLLLQGLETLPLRLRQHNENAIAVANFLKSRPEVSHVIFPGLQSGEPRRRADAYLRGGYGALVGFELNGGVEAGRRFIDALKLFYHVANIGDARSLAIHPASTTHQQLSSDEQLAAGVTPGYVRLSVGIEHPEDIIGDLSQALDAAGGAKDAAPARKAA
ncbi:MAG: PLP-dependent transferase, partial [Hyphomicrobiales bacterium]|nr:PLP-dependent transferase [Hyphomicrobiales bacterium]